MLKNKLNCGEGGEQPKTIISSFLGISLFYCFPAVFPPTQSSFIFNYHTKEQNLFVQLQYILGDCPQALVAVAQT